MHIFQCEISSHSDAAMFMESSNTKSRWILHKNGGIRTHVQCHPKLYILKKKLSLSSNLQNSTFLLSKHFAINKKFQLIALIGYSLITSAGRLSVISEIDVNNGRILYAVATHVFAVAYLALVLEETGAANCSSTSVEDHRAWRRHFVCLRYVQYGPNSVRWDSYRDSCWATVVSQSLPGQEIL